MAFDESSIDVIREATFPASWAWRGYDKAEVEKFLDELADWLADNWEAGTDAELTTSELQVQGDAIATLESRIRELERELGNAGRRERKLRKTLDTARERLQSAADKQPRRAAEQPAAEKPVRSRPARRKRRTTSSWAVVPRGKLDINRVTFEELRGLGLSVSDCARVIALREIRGGFRSLDYLDELPLSEETIRELNARFVVVRDESS